MVNDIHSDGHGVAVELCADFHHLASVGRVGQTSINKWMPPFIDY